ncbi:MAG: YadA-like family protein [Megasphaera sp.]|nr:YadA-like family protein [Megasphaera sp.]
MKANVDASNIGSNITVAPIYKEDDNGQDVIDQDATKKAEDNARTANENAWGTAIGTGKIEKDNGQLVTGKTVYDALHGGLDDVVFGHDGKDGKDGSIGLVGPKGQDGKDGKTTTIIKTETGAAGVNGKDGKDGITRIYYYDQTNPNDKHTVATLDDGMKYVGDAGEAANVKLDHQLKLSGTTFDKDKKYDEKDWTSDNIAVVSNAADATTGDATMYLKLNKDLNLTDKGSVRFGDKNSSTTLDASGLTIKSTVTKEGKTEVVSGPSMTKDGIDGGSKAITNIGSGIEKDDKGNYTDKSKSSAANIGDVQTIVNDAKKELTDGTNGLNSKANVDASNIGENLKDADGKDASDEEVKKNKDAWASAIGTDEVKEGNKQLVTSDAVAKELAKKADKSYVDQELGKKADKTYVDEKLDTKANKSDVYTKDETYSKTEVDSKVTNITNGLNGKAGKDLDNISDKGKTVIHNIAKDAVEVVAGTNTTVTTTKGTDTTPMKYTVAVEGKGKVASGDTGLISGDTLYKEVHVDKDGSYIKSGNTVGQNLSALDTGLKTTSDLIHTNDKGDTIQIGGNSTATKIDVSGKDANGNTTGRVITGVVSDANDPNSAANVGYVNGLTAANTQQIYRDMNNAYSRLDTNINRAAAGSNALAALHPLDFDPADKASFAVGYGHYHNANAAAVGAFYQPNANTMVNMGISLGNGDPGFNAGVSFKIGKGSAYNGVSKAEMAQTIHDQAAEISTIKANDAAKDKRIDALEKENQEMKKQIQEILARLNG